ncbi:hypothetical protein ABZ557_07185 [Streptomyces sp. NPDC019645]|uniref:hypothetical protein n=1 Tax=Streptomyces sp. NPDC019645 TaxID=3154786 RepID=UPI00340F3C62
MRDPRTTHDTTRTGLTTDDLAHPRTGAAPAENDTGDRPPPTFPGEATDVPGNRPPEHRDRPAEPSGAEAPTGHGAATDREASPDTERARDTERAPDTDTAPDMQAAPDAETGAEPAAPAATEERPASGHGTPLIAGEAAESYRDRWQQIQTNFVDDPRDSVRAADSLVADVIQSLAATFADHKQDLESQWSRGEDTQTEELRLALQHYRVFFNQLLDA